MGTVVLNGATSGSTTIQPTDAVTATLTLPSTTGTLLATTSTFAGTGPAFSAYLSGSNQSISAGTFTKVTLNAKEFDTANAFDSTTNYRFQPLVAGYYQVSGATTNNQTTGGSLSSIYKNGSEFKRCSFVANTASGFTAPVSALIYLNGSTDYIELWTYMTNAGNLTASATFNYFQASMVRAA